MNKFKHKDVSNFQGEKYLKNNKPYFEGWYFKNTTDNKSISFIPGISIEKGGKKAFIQVITNDNSYFVDYDISTFKYSKDPFYIKIEDNFFSKEGIYINIKDEKQNLNILGDLNYSNIQKIKTNLLNPNIMGPFSYIPFMECNHDILAMKSNINGIITINNEDIVFNDDTGYIEKDFGINFPKNYIWLQGNNFLENDASFMCSIADIPFKLFHFKGLICVLIIAGKEYKFTTYNHAKVVECDTLYNVDITLKKGNYILNIKSDSNTILNLKAPIKGKMEKDIKESINAVLTLTLKKDNEVIFKDTSLNCGLEIV